MIIAHEDRTFILNLADQGKSPEEIAAALTQRRTLAEVTGVLQDHASRVVVGEIIKSKQHYVFMPPKIAGSITIQPVRVYVRDLAAFCTAHKLSEKEMLRVARGEIDEHRGWRQGPLSGMYCCMTPRALIVNQQDVKERMAGLKQANPGPTTHKSNQADSPTMLPATTFQP